MIDAKQLSRKVWPTLPKLHSVVQTICTTYSPVGASDSRVEEVERKLMTALGRVFLETVERNIPSYDSSEVIAIAAGDDHHVVEDVAVFIDLAADYAAEDFVS